ncbi:helix-turn-helix domain-containing protein [Streptomyces sp. 142MFCol3.1]|uniref:helix-turn-helix domain-containing protein n=1 Tax=Streptomyces sp. 142MFCol3.1 TaxID=1172179 RepID=UPI0004240611|nr:helix-turn-helix transcriptional regulator [Streptomyces sp. 142MFCol3.1]
MSNDAPDEARVIPLRPAAGSGPARAVPAAPATAPRRARPVLAPRPVPQAPPGREPFGGKEPLWRDLVGDVLRRERLAQERTLKDVAEEARISMPYLSELERGRKEASSEVLAAAARALGLGLTDLLTLAQDELVRLDRLAGLGPGRGRGTSVTSAARPSTSGHDGMCLAA